MFNSNHLKSQQNVNPCKIILFLWKILAIKYPNGLTLAYNSLSLEKISNLFMILYFVGYEDFKSRLFF